MNKRQSRALSMIDVARTRGLEIGPLDRPVVTKEMGEVAYVDHATASALKEKYDGDPGVNVDQIVEVDFVHSDRPLVDCVEGDNFDYVVASHTIEHVPDVVGWLREVAEVLTEGGVLSLVIPDKGFTFDYLRPPSTPSEMIDSYLLGSRRPTFRQVYESLAMSVELDVEEARVWPGVVDVEGLRFLHTEESALEGARRATDGEYVDAHCWVFTPQSFFDAIRFLIRLDLFDYKVCHFLPTPEGELEFYVSLEKLPSSSALDERRSGQLDSIPLQESPDRRYRVIPGLEMDGLDDARRRLEAVTMELADERRSGLRRWADVHPWSERVRLAMPHRWGLLDRVMRDRW